MFFNREMFKLYYYIFMIEFCVDIIIMFLKGFCFNNMEKYLWYNAK